MFCKIKYLTLFIAMVYCLYLLNGGLELQSISTKQVQARVLRENPWWSSPHKLPVLFSKWKPRPYLSLLRPLVDQVAIKRAVVLMGPRRVGKTVMIHHMIGLLLEKGVKPKNICYLSVDHPIYNGLSLEDFISLYKTTTGVDVDSTQCFLFFDEIQYLRDWEKHLKALVDTYPNFNCLVSGSAAAALKLKSTESGAGRFTDFLLPPLTFHEYLFLLNKHDIVKVEDRSNRPHFSVENIEEFNSYFIEYLNFGGYPEVVFSEQIRSDPARYIKSDIIDKVLLRDLPTLYGIQDIKELNYLFMSLAFNTAGEISLESLSSGSGVAKNTIKKYIEYLEAAFLLRIIHRVDQNIKIFKRANFFKVYLTNPSIRAALFTPVDANEEEMGALVETAIFSQWFHQDMPLYYARWQRGEVDIVSLGRGLNKADWAVEAKWSDRCYSNLSQLNPLLYFCRRQNLKHALVTTRTIKNTKSVDDITLEFVPASLYCYQLGYNIIQGKKSRMHRSIVLSGDS